MFTAKLRAALRERSASDFFRYAVILLRNAVGLSNRLRSADRDVLEKIILPAYAQLPGTHKVLFVGSDWFTHHYEKLFPGQEYWTLDPDPWKRRFGARRHIVAGLESLDAHFAEGHFDVIVCNGVFGWGLNERADCERAFLNCFTRLRVGGHFMLGWNDVAAHLPLPLDSLASLARFNREPLPALGTAQFMADADTRHRFDFYVKTGG